jgi:hypothetical protein
MQLLAGLIFLLLAIISAAAQDANCDQERSRAEVQRLTSSGAIMSISPFLPDVTVVVDERRWNRASAEERKAMARQVDCAVAGPPNGMLRRIVFRSSGGNQVIASYSSTELMPP